MAPRCRLTLRPNTCTLSSTVSLPMAEKRLSLDERGLATEKSRLQQPLNLRGVVDAKQSRKKGRLFQTNVQLLGGVVDSLSRRICFPAPPISPRLGAWGAFIFDDDHEVPSSVNVRTGVPFGVPGVFVAFAADANRSFAGREVRENMSFLVKKYECAPPLVVFEGEKV